MKTQERERFVVDDKGRRKGIILSIRRYERMKEDLHDLAIAAERKHEKTISADELRKRLGRTGRV